tara:strand:- start:970 stop:1173 length:204 start_codon:yes stop_codon:yes gene_type:complete
MTFEDIKLASTALDGEEEATTPGEGTPETPETPQAPTNMDGEGEGENAGQDDQSQTPGTPETPGTEN